MELTIDQALQKAVEAHKSDKLQDAENLYRAILQTQPKHPDANHNLGVMAVSLNKTAAALPLFKTALEANPNQGQFWLSYVDALIKEKQFENARNLLEQGKKRGLTGEKVEFLEAQLATIFLPQNSDSLSKNKSLPFTQNRKKISTKKEKKKHSSGNLSNQNQIKSLPQIELSTLLKHYQKGQFDLAKNLAISLTRQYPNHPFSWKVLGALFQHTGKLQDSVIANQKALEISPNDEEAHYNLGNTLQALGRLEDAETSYKKAIAIKPDFAQAHNNLGVTLKELGKLDEAETSCNKAIAIKPDFAQAHYNLGVTLQELGRLDEAETSCNKAIAIEPDLAQAHNNLGITLQELGRLEDAEASYSKAIAIKPDFAEAHSNLGNTLKELHRFAEAIKSTTKAIQINPKLAEAQQTHSIILAHLSDFSDVVKHSNAAVALRPDNPTIWESRLFCYIYHPDLSAQEINAEHVRWGTRFPTLDTDIFDLHDRSPSRRLRVGYVSPDFRGHSCRFFFEPLFSQHDHTQFELFAYSNVLTEDEHTQRFKTYFDEWRNILGASDQEVVEMVRRDRIDILVDACGHMQNNRLAVFTHKPAPIQLTWEGYSWTTGLKQMDYVLFDPYMAPPGTLAIEEIIRLPKTRTVFRPGERAVNEPVKSLPALKTGNVTFGYSGRTERLNYKVFNAWVKILERLPTAQLVLDYRVFSDVPTQAYYRDFLAQHGIDVSRVTMRNSSNIFEGLGDIDILLDSFPHNGGTMVFDALWMGVPALTLASRPPVGRIGASVMTNIGLSDWVAKDEYEYVDKAESFAKNVEELARLRAGMRERMKASPLMDEAGFARDVESAFKDMWHRWCSGSKSSYKVSDVDEITTAKSEPRSEQDE